MSDPIDELARLLDETLRANALMLTTSRGGYVGGGQPHPELVSSTRDVEAVARGLLARKVSGPPQPVEYCDLCPHAMHLHTDDGACAGGCHGPKEPTDV